MAFCSMIPMNDNSRFVIGSPSSFQFLVGVTLDTYSSAFSLVWNWYQHNRLDDLPLCVLSPVRFSRFLLHSTLKYNLRYFPSKGFEKSVLNLFECHDFLSVQDFQNRINIFALNVLES
jgi:hypothetical protein